MKTLSVVIGRFQVHMLHGGHTHLIDYAKAQSTDLLILIGSGPGWSTARKPLPFPVRRAMLQAEYPEATILEIHDKPSDEAWGHALDALIDAVFPDHTVTLYGSRDSFISHYHGVKKVEEVPAIDAPSGTSIRESLKSHLPVSADFRHGIIHAHVTRAPIPYPVVDIAIVNRTRREVLLGEKDHDGGKRRFIGGFFDPKEDDSLERAARREAFEETSGMEIADLTYLGSGKIDDWRYRGDEDCLITAFFVTEYVFGPAKASDDLKALHWTPYDEVCTYLLPEHRHLGELLMKHLKS